ncbi:calcium:proton antiporter [Epilithonimonas hispanica]|uniref:Ionic transporter y4hA n=1 Tax=Epilithonimonas hispanica TaxID=358687 RepID=A0A3D9CWN5_9FLAO|nr:ionic transporter y4hA [Epilithonimonas hispanica]REC70152.1 ionic transporter y4hA [Epilithonimonas hispanica]
MNLKSLFHWSYIFPILSVVYYSLGITDNSPLLAILGGALLISSVLGAVHHAEVVAHKVGEPFGTIILAIAITVLEVGLIVSLMVAGGKETDKLARDTVFAAVMLILNGILGACLLLGGIKFKEQFFARTSGNMALISLVAIVVMTLILPNYTTTELSATFSKAQLIFFSIASLIIYSTFLMVQTVRHRNYFLPENDDEQHAEPPTNFESTMSLIFLIICLGVVVFLAKALSPQIENMVHSFGAPQALVGVIIAAVVLLPEGMAALKAARRNQFQTSLNLALGSAIASIGLTIPCVAVVSIIYEMPLLLGLDIKSMVLLALSLYTVMLSLNRGKTNILYGVVLLVNLFAYIFTVIVP